MNVLSLFDGISCGHVALERAGIHVDKYYASEIKPYAIKVTQRNYPDTIQLGDVTKLDFKSLKGRIYLLIGGSPCFTADTLVMTDRGMKPIADIVEGDMVLTHNSRYRKVTKTGSHMVNEIAKVKGMGCHELCTTRNHPFYIRNMFRQYDSSIKRYARQFTEPEWVPVENFQMKSAYYGTTFATNQCQESQYSELFWYFVGRFVGDGWTYKTKRKHRQNSFLYKVFLCCGKDEFDEVKELMDKLGYTYHYVEERTVYKFCISQQGLHEYLALCGHGALNKCVHPDLWKLDIKYKRAFLNGYMSADGDYEPSRDTWHYGTTSRRLMYELKILNAEVYHTPTSLWCTHTREESIIEGRVVKNNPYYKCSFFKDGPRKQSKAFYEDSYTWSPIKSVEYTNQRVRVYNLEVEEDHSYTANTVVVHNCQSFSITQGAKRLNFDGKSRLFFEYLRALEEVHPKYFLLENVASMKDECRDIISSYLGVQPVLINSNCFSAQDRPRYYWTNIPVDTSNIHECSLTLKDIIETEVDEKYYYTQDYDYLGDKSVCATLHINGHDILKRVHSPNYKCHTLTAVCGGNQQKKVLVDGRVRKLTPLEYERLQTLPENYTSGISDTQRWNVCGDGWTVDVITHILKGLKDIDEK